jgi:hypothetical protein
MQNWKTRFKKKKTLRHAILASISMSFELLQHIYNSYHCGNVLLPFMNSTMLEELIMVVIFFFVASSKEGLLDAFKILFRLKL